MGASVRVEASALNDPRFAVFARKLARRAKWRLPKAVLQDYGRGVIERVWSYCTEREIDTIDRDLVDEIIGHEGATCDLIAADLASVAGCDTVRIKGGDRLMWLAKKRRAARQGAEKRWNGDASGIAVANKSDASGNAKSGGVAGQKECPIVTVTAPAPATALKDTVPCASVNARSGQFDFEEVYKLYPRKLGKAAGLKRLRKTVRNQSDFERFKASVERMAKLWANATPAQKEFCPHFSTYVNQERWRDEEQPAPKAEGGPSSYAAANPGATYGEL